MNPNAAQLLAEAHRRACSVTAVRDPSMRAAAVARVLFDLKNAFSQAPASADAQPGLNEAHPLEMQMQPDVRILVLQRGWVAVGNYSADGDDVTLQNAKIVRRWGTTKGLGEIAAKGPTRETVLDDVGQVQVHRLGVVLAITCEPTAWKL